MKTIELTDVELRALKILLDANACFIGCAFEEMIDEPCGCNACPFTLAVNSIEEKLELIGV